MADIWRKADRRFSVPDNHATSPFEFFFTILEDQHHFTVRPSPERKSRAATALNQRFKVPVCTELFKQSKL
jgi:hypothetical protein